MKAPALFLSVTPLRRTTSSLRGRRAMGSFVIGPLVLCFLLACPSESLAQNDGEYRIRVKANGRFLHEDGLGDQLISTRYQVDDDFTRFILERQPDESYRIRVKANGHFLHEDGLGDQLISTRYQVDDDFTRFILIEQSDGSYRIRVKANGRFLHEDGLGDQLVSTRAQEEDDFTRFFLEPQGALELERQRQAELERQRATLLRLFGNDQFVSIPAGSFQMGSASVEVAGPVHTVQISSSFQMGKYEVTQGQFRAFVEATGYRTEAEQRDGCYLLSYGGTRTLKAGASWKNTFEGDDRPVVCVSWNDAQAFVQWLNEQEWPAKYRLPTGAEWEYAARAGTTGDHAGNFAAMAWNQSNSDGRTHEVGQKRPNAWGLYDMYGNVYEWVEDWYGVYPTGSVTDPTGPPSGSARVIRGGGWDSTHIHAQSAYRGRLNPSRRYSYLGFRLVRTAL